MTREQLLKPERTHPPLGAFLHVPAGDTATSGDAVAVHYLEMGPANGQEIILIHGASGNLRDFAFGLMGRLAERYRVIAFDRPGFGYSERPEKNGARPDVQARILRRAADAIGASRPIVVGHSFGGAPALAWAIQAPDQVAGVLTIAGVSHAWPGSISRRYDLAAAPFVGPAMAHAVTRFASPDFIARELSGIFEPGEPPEGYLDFIGVGLALRPSTFQANGQDVSRLKPFLQDQQRRYPDLPMPIVALHGASDTIVPLEVHARPLSERAPHGRLVALHDAGHMPHHTHSDAVLSAIDDLAATGRAA